MTNPVRVSLVLAAAVLLAALPAGAAAKGGKTVTITAKLTGSAASIAGLRVLVLPTRGSSVTVTPKGGRISAKLAASSVNGTSLQLIARDGSYAGPVLLNRSGTKGATRLATATSATVALGTIRVTKGYGALITALPTAMTLAKGKVALTKSGAPVGAGRLGLVRRATAKASRQGGGGAPGGACTSSSATDAAAGGDCDQDGVPNAVDVDDNGNLTLDAVDPVSSQVSAKLNPYSGLRPSMQNTSNVYIGTTRDQINASLGAAPSAATGATANLGISFYLDQRYLDATGSTAFDFVWISCPAQMAWCAPGTGTASISGFSEARSLLPGMPEWGSMPWRDYTGSECQQGIGCTATNGPSGNAFVELYRNDGGGGGGGPVLPTWVAMVAPNSPDTLGGVVPGDVVTINAQRQGVVTQVPISISPYFVTSPALQSVNGTTVAYPLTADSPGTNESTAITLGSDGLLTLRFWRPQRFGLPGETAAYYDVAGLHWGATLDFLRGTDNSEQRPSREGGCAVSAPSGLSARAYSSSPQDPFNSIVPLVDDTTADFATDTANAANTVVGFTIDVRACAQANGLNPASGAKAAMTLQGVGEALTGGANRSGLSLYVKFP